MSDIRPILFADGVIEAQVANGVARITLAMTGGDGKAVPCGVLCVPVTQLPGMVNGMGNLLRQIEDRVRAQMAQQKQGAAGDGAAAADAAGPAGAFRFQG
jgi:hypothetical protein